jgi:hypothetical protein
MNAIWAITDQKPAPAFGAGRPVLVPGLLDLLVHLLDALADQERPADEQDDVPPRDAAGLRGVQQRQVREGEHRPG